MRISAKGFVAFPKRSAYFFLPASPKSPKTSAFEYKIKLC